MWGAPHIPASELTNHRALNENKLVISTPLGINLVVTRKNIGIQRVVGSWLGDWFLHV